MDGNNNNTNFIPVQQLPLYHINTDMCLRILDSLLFLYFNRQGVTLTHREMRNEFYRWITFCDFPPTPRDIREFVKAGFYYTRDRDFVVCYCCGFYRGNWMIEEIPLDIHQRFSPDCIFFHANSNVNIPFFISPGRNEIYDPRQTRLREQNVPGPSLMPESIVREDEEFERVQRLHLEENEHDEIYETLPMANLPELQVASDRNNILDYFEGVQMRLYSTSSSQESDLSTFIAHMYQNEMIMILHSPSVNTSPSENSELRLMDNYDFQIVSSQRNLGHTFVVHDRNRLSVTGQDYGFTSDIETEEQCEQENQCGNVQVIGNVSTESRENDTNETERKTTYQPEIHYRPEFATNGRKDNISHKFIHIQTLVKGANNIPAVQIEMPSGLNHHNDTFSMKNNVDDSMPTEVTCEEITNDSRILDCERNQPYQCGEEGGQMHDATGEQKSIFDTSELNENLIIDPGDSQTFRKQIEDGTPYLPVTTEPSDSDRADSKYVSPSLKKEIRVAYEQHQNHTTNVSEIHSQNGQLNSIIQPEDSVSQTACETDSNVTNENKKANVDRYVGFANIEDADTRENLNLERTSCTDNKSTSTHESVDRANTTKDDNQLAELTQKKQYIQTTELYNERRQKRDLLALNEFQYTEKSSSESYAMQDNKENNDVSQNAESGTFSQTDQHNISAHHINENQNSAGDTDQDQSQVMNHANTVKSPKTVQHTAVMEENREADQSKLCQQKGDVLKHYINSDKSPKNSLGTIEGKGQSQNTTASASSVNVQDDEAIRPETRFCVGHGPNDINISVDRKRNAEALKEASNSKASLNSDVKKVENSPQNGPVIAQENGQVTKADQHSIMLNTEGISVARDREGKRSFLLIKQISALADEFWIGDNRSRLLEDGVWRLNVAIRSTNDIIIQGKAGKLEKAELEPVGANALHSTVSRPDEMIDKKDRKIASVSKEDRHVPTEGQAQTSEISSKTKHFSPADNMQHCTNKETIRDDDDFQFTIEILNAMKKIKDLKRKGDLKEECINMIARAQQAEIIE